jgi:hypothetical protein
MFSLAKGSFGLKAETLNLYNIFLNIISEDYKNYIKRDPC